MNWPLFFSQPFPASRANNPARKLREDRRSHLMLNYRKSYPQREEKSSRMVRSAKPREGKYLNLNWPRSGCGERRRSVSKIIFDGGGDGKHGFVGERESGDLDTDGQAFARASHRKNGGGRGEQVEPLRVAHGIEIAN